MDKINFKQIDLLRKRRKVSKLFEPYFVDTKKYIKNGIFLGLILIAISLELIGISVESLVITIDSIKVTINSKELTIKIKK